MYISPIFVIEVVLKHRLRLWNSGGSTDLHDIVDFRFIHLGLGQRLFHQCNVALNPLNRSAHNSSNSANDGGLDAGRKCALGALSGCSQSSQRTGIGRDIFLVFALAFVGQMGYQSVAKIITTHSQS